MHFQLRIKAADRGIPPKYATVDVDVFVLRNQFVPTFSENVYYKTIEESQSPGTIILNTSASDEDSRRQPGVSTT